MSRLYEQGVPPRPHEAVVGPTEPDDIRRRAGTFFLGWLILAASMSLAGNVGHALLISASQTRWLAALAALVPPIVLLAATHSATWLVRARSVGWVYWVALAFTAALALGSFALSFDALRSFAVMLGIRESMSWIWPAVIDVAIAHATLCLLSLTRPTRAKAAIPLESRPAAMASETSATAGARIMTTELAEDPPRPLAPQPPSPPVMVTKPSTGATGVAPDSDAANAAPTAAAVAGAAAAPMLSTRQAADMGAVQRSPERALSAVPAAGTAAPPRVLSAMRSPGEPCTEDAAPVDRWQPVAESLVRDGITTKDPDLIAKILADNAAGTPPSTIGRRHEVHHTMVNRILSAAEQLSELGTATG